MGTLTPTPVTNFEDIRGRALHKPSPSRSASSLFPGRFAAPPGGDVATAPPGASPERVGYSRRRGGGGGGSRRGGGGWRWGAGTVAEPEHGRGFSNSFSLDADALFCAAAAFESKTKQQRRANKTGGKITGGKEYVGSQEGSPKKRQRVCRSGREGSKGEGEERHGCRYQWLLVYGGQYVYKAI